MTIRCRSWLPADAKAPFAAIAAIGDSVETWSAEWFAGDGWRLAGSFVRSDSPRSELRNASRHVCDDGLALVIGRGSVETIGALVLSVPAGDLERTAADTVLLEKVGAECFDALKLRLAALFEIDRGANWYTGDTAGLIGPIQRISIVASPSTELQIAVELSEELFARFVKSRLAPPAPDGRLGAPAQALAGLRIDLSAALGKCDLNVAQLSRLAPGDVLRLDRALDQEVPLAVGFKPLGRGACTVVQNDGALALELTQSPVG